MPRCLCGCGREASPNHRGLNPACYERNRRKGTLKDVAAPSKKPRNRRCRIFGCNRKHKGLGYCERHYYTNRAWAEYEPAVGKKKELEMAIAVMRLEKYPAANGGKA